MTIKIILFQTVQCTGFDFSTNTKSDLDDILIKDESWDEYRPVEDTLNHLSDLVISVQTLYDGDLGFHRMVCNTLYILHY